MLGDAKTWGGHGLFSADSMEQQGAEHSGIYLQHV